MVALHVVASSPVLLPLLAAASAHGLTDVRRPLRHLAPYSLVLVPVDTHVVTALFLACSVQHFARDVGRRRSLLLHVAFPLLHAASPPLAWTTFAAYYCGVHVPRHVGRAHRRGEVDAGAWRACAVVAIVAAACMAGRQECDITDAMQLGVVAHVLVDEGGRA